MHHQFVASARVVKRGHEINPDFKIGCMIAMVPVYPFSCHPDDVMLAKEAMHQRYVFSDVQMRGYYPAYALKEWERAKATTLRCNQRMQIPCVRAVPITSVSAIT